MLSVYLNRVLTFSGVKINQTQTKRKEQCSESLIMKNTECMGGNRGLFVDFVEMYPS